MIHVEQEPGSEITIPRAALAGMALMVVTSILLATAGRWTGTGTVGNPTIPAASGVSVQIAFERGANDVITVVAADDRRTLRVLDAGEGGFLRGVLRPLDRERMRAGADADAPYELTYVDGASPALVDRTTGLTVDVAAFGRSNAGVFEALLIEASAR